MLKRLSHFLITTFEVLTYNRLFILSLTSLFEISTKASYQFGSNPTRLHETFLGSDPNGITFEGDPAWIRIADPGGFGSVGSGVNARPIRYSLGMDPFGTISCKHGSR